MPSHPAIRVDDNLAPCETRVSVRSADDKSPCRIDVILRVGIHQVLWRHRIDHILAHVRPQLFGRDFFAVLGRNYDGVDAARLPIDIFDR